MHLIFQQLSGLCTEVKLKRLLQSPFTLHKGLLRMIEREAEHARAGRPGMIQATMNALNSAQSPEDIAAKRGKRVEEILG